MENNKKFEDFRNNWLDEEKLKSILNQSLDETSNLQSDDSKSFMATFSATYSLLLLAEYHDWLNQQ